MSARVGAAATLVLSGPSLSLVAGRRLASTARSLPEPVATVVQSSSVLVEVDRVAARAARDDVVSDPTASESSPAPPRSDLRSRTDEEAWRLDELREEARYRRERLELYRARMYGGRAHSDHRLREYQRASEGAAARLRRAEGPGP